MNDTPRFKFKLVRGRSLLGKQYFADLLASLKQTYATLPPMEYPCVGCGHTEPHTAGGCSRFTEYEHTF